jgi:GH24 family phage-related lysozyme (muramidase)
MNILELIEQRRIALTPEYEGGWHADIYDDEETATVFGYGDTVEEAILNALKNEDE